MAYKQWKFISQNSEAGKSKIKAWYLARTQFLVHILPSFCCPHRWKRQGSSGVSLVRPLIPFLKAPLSRLNYFPKLPSPKTITLGVMGVCWSSVVSDSVRSLWTVARQAPLPMEFSKQEFWSGMPFLSPGDLPDPGIELASPASPALTDGFFTTEPLGKPIIHSLCCSLLFSH